MAVDNSPSKWKNLGFRESENKVKKVKKKQIGLYVEN
jgi:hypothetical protein